MALENKTFFSKLSNESAESKWHDLEDKKGKFTIWLPKNDQRQHFQIKSIQNSVITVEKKSATISNAIYFFHFELEGQAYFGKVEAHHALGSDNVNLHVLETYKTERRGAFRLPLYPHQNVVGQVFFEKNIIEEKKSNVVNLKLKKSQTEILKNFMTLVDKEQQKPNQLNVVVLDISTGGTGFLIDPWEKIYFENNKPNEIKIEFRKIKLTINHFTIVYLIDFQNKVKVGVRFDKIDSEVERQLFQEINKDLKDYQKILEGLLK